MDTLIWFSAAAVVAGCIAGIVLWLGLRFTTPSGSSREADPPALPESRFVIDGERIIDSDHAGAAALKSWGDLRRWLGPGFADLPQMLPVPTAGETMEFCAGTAPDCMSVGVAMRGRRHLVRLRAQAVPSAAQWHEALRAVKDENLLRQAAQAAPVAICVVDARGAIAWKNALFAGFDEAQTRLILDAALATDGQGERPLKVGDRHFVVTKVAAEGHVVLYAADVTRLVRADSIRMSFIQTLTKTFADLSTGLAVFDRKSRLVIFNPALIDLTGLSAEFLSARPDLMDFFDRLRDRQVLPEPRNYASWRAQIGEMIETASEGSYCEAWSLPTGLTYRVTGRPHPDGAVAFLIEDISDEISLTRRSRSELEMRQAALDRMDDAVAVFAHDGMLAFCNRSFREFLGFDPDSRLAETKLADVIAVCRSRFAASPVWEELAAPDHDLRRQKREFRVQSRAQGDATRCRVVPLPDGFTMLSLMPLAAVEPA